MKFQLLPMYALSSRDHCYVDSKCIALPINNWKDQNSALLVACSAVVYLSWFASGRYHFCSFFPIP